MPVFDAMDDTHETADVNAPVPVRVFSAAKSYRIMRELIFRYEVPDEELQSAEMEAITLLPLFASLNERSLESFSPPKPYPDHGP